MSKVGTATPRVVTDVLGLRCTLLHCSPVALRLSTRLLFALLRSFLPTTSKYTMRITYYVYVHTGTYVRRTRANLSPSSPSAYVHIYPLVYVV